MIRNSLFDLTLPDVQFPGIGRLEVLKHIVENPASWQMGTVTFTSQVLGSDKKRFIEVGCINCISRPVGVFQFMDERNTFLSNGKA